MGEQEYYIDGEYVTIYGEVKDEENLVIVRNDHQELSVVNRERLITKENSYSYRRAQERKQELEQITAEAQKNLDAISDKIVNKALQKLATRMKFNTLFSKDLGNSSGWAIMVSNELEKLIKEDGPKVVKEKEDIFG